MASKHSLERRGLPEAPSGRKQANRRLASLSRMNEPSRAAGELRQLLLPEAELEAPGADDGAYLGCMIDHRRAVWRRRVAWSRLNVHERAQLGSAQEGRAPLSEVCATRVGYRSRPCLLGLAAPSSAWLPGLMMRSSKRAGRIGASKYNAPQESPPCPNAAPKPIHGCASACSNRQVTAGSSATHPPPCRLPKRPTRTC